MECRGADDLLKLSIIRHTFRYYLHESLNPCGRYRFIQDVCRASK